MSALWINLVGHKFDAVLSKNAYGARLRRLRPEEDSLPAKIGKYHREAIASFQPYFGPYKAWRENGLAAIRNELQVGNAVVAASMDLASYYHNVDPTFMADSQFLKVSGIQLNPWELAFTKSFSLALVEWSGRTLTRISELRIIDKKPEIGGIPIGISISRIIANALLNGLDRDIEEGLAPVFYGRYVDDIFLVIRDPGSITDSKSLLNYLSARTKWFPPKEKDQRVSLKIPRSYKNKTKLWLQKSKLKTFLLNEQGGFDLLDSIEAQIRSVSSERRFMPLPEKLETMASAKVLTAGGHPSQEADTLRRADGLSVRRLGWAVQLRAVETLARDLRQEDWKEERSKFYQFSVNHILRPDRILEQIDYLPRLMSLAVALMDWADASRLYEVSSTAIESLRNSAQVKQIKINGVCVENDNSDIWSRFAETVKKISAESLLRALRWDGQKGTIRPLSAQALRLCERLNIGSDIEEISNTAQALRECDWAKTSYKNHLRRDAATERQPIPNENLLYGIYERESDLVKFLTESKIPSNCSSGQRIHERCRSVSNSNSSRLPYLFPTRPYTAEEVSLFLPDKCIFGGNGIVPEREWAKYVRAIRGVWVRESLVTDESDPISQGKESKSSLARIGRNKSAKKVLLGISSLLTTDESFKAAASGRPDISRERYGRIERIVNLAIDAQPRPSHLLLPELALPERWIESVSRNLQSAGISLIAGLDYQHTGKGQINSEAVLVLVDDRLGYPSVVQIRQPKSLPAPGEEQTLLELFGKEWLEESGPKNKPIYVHRGFCFGVLVCSELQNVSHRLSFQGEVDCLMVLSWNQDIETFSSLVESASLDVHAHIALVNNRHYGDSRVRSPEKNFLVETYADCEAVRTIILLSLNSTLRAYAHFRAGLNGGRKKPIASSRFLRASEYLDFGKRFPSNEF